MQANNLIDPATAPAARSLNARLREASQREGLLRVLCDTATDLTGIRDVEAVLKAIVRRTRSLIGSDVACDHGPSVAVQGKVISELLVTDRHAHNSSSDDVALMESIGTHAAVARGNTHHFPEMADALAPLDQAQRSCT